MKQDDFSDFDDFADFDDFGDEVPPVESVSRRIDPLTVTWRGSTRRFEPTDALNFHNGTKVVGAVTLFEPTTAGHPFPRECWIADVWIWSFGFIEAEGNTAQQALDALDASLPFNLTAMVCGGYC